MTSYTSAGVVTQTVTYAYDAVGRQVSETVAVAGGATTETKFIYDGQAIVATLDGTNALTNRYLDGPMVDQVFADEQFDPTEAGELPTAAGIVLYPLVDNQGTARDLVEYDAATATTTIVNHITYTAFGAVTSQSDTGVAYLFGYTGFVHDTATGLDKSMTRYYDAVDGLWTQQDPIGFAAGDINLARYVLNNPAELTDPTGKEPKLAAYIASLAAPLQQAMTQANAAADKLTTSLQKLGQALQSPSNQAAITAARTETTKALNAASAAADLVKTRMSSFVQALDPVLRRGDAAKEIIATSKDTIANLATRVNTISQLDGIYRQFPILAKRCDKAADLAAKVLGKGAEILKITGQSGEQFFIIGGRQFSDTGEHQVVRYGDKIYDALTGPAGLATEEYFQLLADKVQLVNPNTQVIKVIP